MIIVLDSNEYINFLSKKQAQLSKVLESHTVHANELVVKEVLRNVPEGMKKDFYALLMKNSIVLHSEKLPKHLQEKYEKRGLKKGDIVIAAFCENIKADYLISENRHFLRERVFDKFNVVNLKGFLKFSSGQK